MTEILVSVGVGAIVILGLAVASVYGMEQFELIREMNETEKSFNLALYHLRARLSQAIEICATDGSVVAAPSACADAVGGGPRAAGPGQNAVINVAAASAIGRIGGNRVTNNSPRCCVAGQAGCAATTLPFNASACGCVGAGICYGYDSTVGGLAAQDGTPDTIAVFNEEIGNYANTGVAPSDVGSTFRSVGIYFRRPNSNDTGVGSSGVLYFSLGAPPLTPNPGSVTINRLVSLRVEVTPVDPAAAPPNLKAQRAKIYLTARYFLDSAPRNYTYTYWSLLAGVFPAYRDISGDIEIGFRNNALSASQIAGAAVVERLHGPLYYFRFNPPATDIAGF